MCSRAAASAVQIELERTEAEHLCGRHSLALKWCLPSLSFSMCASALISTHCFHQTLPSKPRQCCPPAATLHYSLDSCIWIWSALGIPTPLPSRLQIFLETIPTCTSPNAPQTVLSGQAKCVLVYSEKLQEQDSLSNLKFSSKSKNKNMYRLTFSLQGSFFLRRCKRSEHKIKE